MPFDHNDMRSYTRANVQGLNRNQNGVYGIFQNDKAIYIGSGDIRQRLLDHLNGDNACIVRYNPNLWTGLVFSGDPIPREKQLIREYQPPCNQQFRS